MLNAMFVVVGAVLAWLAIDSLLALRAQRKRHGRIAWLEVSADRSFHSTGWEETVSPLEALEPGIDRRGSRTAERKAA